MTAAAAGLALLRRGVEENMRRGVMVIAAALLGVALASTCGASAARADAQAAAAAGSAWNQAAVSGIESTARVNYTPVFPDRTCAITDPGYAGLVRQVTDGQGSSVQSVVWYYGDAINAAIADCHARGGGVVVVPASGSLNGSGVYYSGAITLLSNVDLQVDTGATIKFVRNPSNAYYPVVLTSYQGIDLYDYSPLVYALNQKNIALTGGGTLDAQDNVGAAGSSQPVFRARPPGHSAPCPSWAPRAFRSASGYSPTTGTCPPRFPSCRAARPSRGTGGRAQECGTSRRRPGRSPTPRPSSRSSSSSTTAPASSCRACTW